MCGLVGLQVLSESFVFVVFGSLVTAQYQHSKAKEAAQQQQEDALKQLQEKMWAQRFQLLQQELDLLRLETVRLSETVESLAAQQQEWRQQEATDDAIDHDAAAAHPSAEQQTQRDAASTPPDHAPSWWLFGRGWLW